MAAQRKTKPENLYQEYCDALRTWAADVPSDIMDEDDKEKILDAMLRLFEALDAHNLRGAMSVLRTQKSPRELLEPLTAAIRWQMIGLNIQLPVMQGAVAPHILSLAVARWAMIWQGEYTPGMPKLMAAIDKDLGRLEKISGYFNPGFFAARAS